MLAAAKVLDSAGVIFITIKKSRLAIQGQERAINTLSSPRTLAKGFYSSRPGSAWDFTHVRLIFMNDSFIKCVSSILKY